MLQHFENDTATHIQAKIVKMWTNIKHKVPPTHTLPIQGTNDPKQKVKKQIHLDTLSNFRFCCHRQLTTIETLLLFKYVFVATTY